MAYPSALFLLDGKTIGRISGLPVGRATTQKLKRGLCPLFFWVRVLRYRWTPYLILIAAAFVMPGPRGMRKFLAAAMVFFAGFLYALHIREEQEVFNPPGGFRASDPA